MILTEGRNRQIRKMMAALGYRVVKLQRVAMGSITFSGVKGPGDWKRLSGDDLEFVRRVLWKSQNDSKELN